MAYDQQTWVLGITGGTALSAVRLNHMEQGIADAHTLIADLAAASHTHTSAQITDATAANVVNTLVLRDATGFVAVSGITGLSTATGSTQAVPKSQLDAAIAGVSGSGHTHTVSQVTDVTATGASLATAVDASAVRDILDVDSTSESDTKDAATLAAAQAYADTAEADAVATAETYTDTVTDRMTHTLVYSAGWPLRPNTTGTNQVVQWVGSNDNPVSTDGTTSGGTAAAAPGDLIFYTDV